jgi:hypothetical protein
MQLVFRRLLDGPARARSSKVEGEKKGKKKCDTYFVFLAPSTTFIQTLWFCPGLPVLNCGTKGELETRETREE